MKKLNVLIADDHQILRDGIKLILADDGRFSVIAEADNGQDAIQMISELKPDIAILDISMPGLSGIDVARQTKKYYPETKIIMLTQHEADLYKMKAADFGVEGFLSKDNASDSLIEAVLEISRGKTFYENAESEIQDRQITVPTDLSELSDREKEILKLIAEGNSNADIATILFISELTVKTHRSNINSKMGTSNLAELTTFAIRNGLVEL